MDRKKEQLTAVRKYVFELFSNDSTGHDFFHMERVAYLARLIATKENGDSFICQLAGWLHDVGDHKLFDEPKVAIAKMNQFLRNIKLSDEEINAIHLAIQDVSFSKHKVPQTLAGKIVQDADRLDAIGAIGIARTFAYGGANHQPIYHSVKPQKTSLQHFYDKLFKLKDLLHTHTARQLAEERHSFMEGYVDRFLKEWNMVHKESK